MGTVTINGNTLDLAAPTLQALGLWQETADKSNYILIQLNGPLTKGIKKELAEKKVEVQEKVSADTYLCRYAPAVLPTSMHMSPCTSLAY